MDRMWSRDSQPPTSVRELFEELAAERTIAYTTVMSTMDNLHRKGWLKRERDGKAYRYWPSLTREQHSARLMREALDGGGSPELVLQHFVEQIGAEESERLRWVLRRRAKGTTQRSALWLACSCAAWRCSSRRLRCYGQ